MKGCVTVPNRGTQLSLRYFNANINWFSHKSTSKQKVEMGVSSNKIESV